MTTTGFSLRAPDQCLYRSLFGLAISQIEGGLVRAYFDNLLPDSQAIRERLARRFRATSVGAFDLLAEIN